MISIRCRIHVDETGRAVLQLPREVFPGEHEVIVSVSEALPSPEHQAELHSAQGALKVSRMGVQLRCQLTGKTVE